MRCRLAFYTVGEGSGDCDADAISFLSRVCMFPGKGEPGNFNAKFLFVSGG